MNRASPSGPVDENPDWWRQEKTWRQPRLPSRAGRNALWLWLFGAVFIGLAMPATLAIPEELDKGNEAILAVLLFQLVGAGLWLAALREAWAWRRYGEIYAVVEPWPGQVGGHVAGYFELEKDLPAEHDLTVTLRCLKQRQGSKNNVSTAVWVDELRLQPQRGRQIWFCFEPPAGLPESQPRAREYHYWELQLRVEQQGPDIQRSYRIPVVAGEQRNARAQRRLDLNPEPMRARLQRIMNPQLEGDELRLHYRAGRDAGAALGLIAFSLITLGSAAFVASFGSLTLVMAAGFTLVAVPMLLGGLWWLGRQRWVYIGPDLIAAKVLWLGLPLFTRRLPRSAARRLGFKRRGSMHSKQRSVVWHDLLVHGDNGASLVIGKGFQSEREVRAAAEELARLTGLAAPSA